MSLPTIIDSPTEPVQGIILYGQGTRGFVLTLAGSPPSDLAVTIHERGKNATETDFTPVRVPISGSTNLRVQFNDTQLKAMNSNSWDCRIFYDGNVQQQIPLTVDMVARGTENTQEVTIDLNTALGRVQELADAMQDLFDSVNYAFSPALIPANTIYTVGEDRTAFAPFDTVIDGLLITDGILTEI